MAFFRRLRGWFSRSQSSKTISSTQALSDILDKARRAQYDEDYTEALKLLETANTRAEKEQDSRSLIDISLSRADIMIAQDKLETAEFVLKELRQDCEGRGIKAPLAYALASLGYLEQKRGNWASAQEFYETARETANGIKTDGATGRATAHLAEVYLHDENANYAIYLLEEALPKLEKSGDRELLGHFQAMLGLAQIQSGNQDAGIKAILTGLETANQLKHRGQIRALNRLLGTEYLANGNYHKAEQYLMDASRYFTESQQSSSDYGKLLAQLAKANLKLKNNAAAKTYANQALSLAQALNEEKLALEAKSILGLLLDDDTALAYLQDAVQAYEAVPHEPMYIEILRRIANLQDADSAEASFQKALESAQDNPLLLGQVQSDLALFYSNAKRQRDAISAWQAAAKAYQVANQAGQVARSYCELAALYEQIGDGRMALREYGSALEQLGRVEDVPTRGLILANVAAAYSELGDVESAQDFFKESIEIAQRSQDTIAEALRRGNYGRLLALTNRAKQALPQINQALAQTQKLDLTLESAIMRGNQALAFAIQEDYPAAEASFQQAAQDLAVSEANYWQAVLHANWGDCIVAQKNNDTAKSHYQQALDLAKAENFVALLVQSHIGLAELAYLEKDFASAEKYLSEIDSPAKRLVYKRLLALLHQTWSKVYAAQGKNEEAAAAWEEAKKHRSLMRMPPINADWLN